ncbi:MAG TPA: hypothetical protein VGD78_04570 [Chthoniobacterales bacterium]
MTLKEALSELQAQSPDTVLSDGATDWSPGNLYDSLQEEHNPSLNRLVYVDQGGIRFVNVNGSHTTSSAYTFKDTPGSRA